MRIKQKTQNCLIAKLGVQNLFALTIMTREKNEGHMKIILEMFHHALTQC